MGVAILQAETLNLPERFAVKLRGKKVELIEDGDTITIKPVQFAIDEAYGMFEGSSFGTEEFLKQKRMDKELEYGN